MDQGFVDYIPLLEQAKTFLMRASYVEGARQGRIGFSEKLEDLFFLAVTEFRSFGAVRRSPAD